MGWLFAVALGMQEEKGVNSREVKLQVGSH
jgi:hypothetical protein